CSTSNFRRPIASKPQSSTARRMTFAGIASTAGAGFRRRKQSGENLMPSTIFIDTNTVPRLKTSQGAVTEILTSTLAGAKNVLGTLRWLKSGEAFKADAGNKHQLIYLMDGNGSMTLENKSHDVSKGMGVYLGPAETATIQAAQGGSLKLFHLI